MNTKFTVGRVTPYDGVYDLEECPVFDDLSDAVKDLVDRSSEQDIAEVLQVLEVECDENDNIMSYSVVPSGAVLWLATKKE